jgi:DNA-binding transcriptional LysR family regulator
MVGNEYPTFRENMMDRLEAMSVFAAVVEAGSFSGAARMLRVPLNTVSRRVADLEAHLQTRLLARSTRRLELTDAGRAYLAAARQILELVGDAERAAGGEYDTPRGDLVVTAPLAFGRLQVLPVVAEFLARFPDIQVKLLLADRNLQLIDEHIDVAVRVGHLPDSTLVSSRVGVVHRVVCASPGYLAGHGAPRTLDDLVDHIGVTFENLPAGPPWAFKAKGEGLAQATLRARLTVNSAEAAVDAAAAGVGLAHVLSYQAAPAVRAGRVTLLLRAYEPPGLPVHLVHARQGALPLKSRSFLDFAVTRLRASLSALPTEAAVSPS